MDVFRCEGASPNRQSHVEGGCEGERFKEGISINYGLLALGNVISALGVGHAGAAPGHALTRPSPSSLIFVPEDILFIIRRTHVLPEQFLFALLDTITP